MSNAVHVTLQLSVIKYLCAKSYDSVFEQILSHITLKWARYPKMEIITGNVRYCSNGLSKIVILVKKAEIF